MTHENTAILPESAGVVKWKLAAGMYHSGTPERCCGRRHIQAAPPARNEYRTPEPSQGALCVLASALKAPVDTTRRFFFGELSKPGVLPRKSNCPESKHESSS